jgi:hypothetical protein
VTDDVRWLDSTQQGAWRGLLALHVQLAARLNRDLQRTSGLSLSDYDVLVQLTDVADGRLRVLELGEALQCEVLPLELVDPHYYHLDTCFCPLAPGEAIWYPGAFDDYGRRALAERVEQLIPVASEEAQSFACNAVVIGKHVITNTGCQKLHAALTERGYTTHETPLSEFVKAGGSAKCLTLRLDGEEAAAWTAHAA